MIFLRAYKPPGADDVVTVWYAGANPTAKANLDARMVHLRTQERDKWIRPYYDGLEDGVGEVRWKAIKINHRGLGYFGPERNQFTFLLFATKTNVFDPRNAISKAVERKVIVENDPSLSVAIKGRWNQK